MLAERRSLVQEACSWGAGTVGTCASRSVLLPVREHWTALHATANGCADGRAYQRPVGGYTGGPRRSLVDPVPAAEGWSAGYAGGDGGTVSLCSGRDLEREPPTEFLNAEFDG